MHVSNNKALYAFQEVLTVNKAITFYTLNN